VNETPSPDYDTALGAALYYASLGWWVFPCHSVYGKDRRCDCGQEVCDRAGKHPHTRNGLTDATTDPKVIRAWWQRWPSANVAIATGKKSGLWVVDVEREGLDRHARLLLDLPDTVEGETGGAGRHLFFRYPADGEWKNHTGLLPELDIRGEGGYVIAAPSLHRSGGRYEWDGFHAPDCHELADAPGELLAVSRERSAGKSSAKECGNGEFPPAQVGPILAGCGWLRGAIQDAAILSEPEWKAQADLAACLEGGRELFHQWSAPYPDYHPAATDAKFDRAASPTRPPRCSRIAADLPHGAACASCPHRGRVKSPIVLGMPPPVRWEAGSRAKANGEDGAAAVLLPPPLTAEEAEAQLQELHGLLAGMEPEARDVREVLKAADLFNAVDTPTQAAYRTKFKALFGSALNLNDLSKEQKEARRRVRPARAERGPRREDLPQIVVTDNHLRDLMTQSLEALEGANLSSPRLFVRSGEVVQVALDEKEQPCVKAVSRAAMRNELERAANFVREVVTEETVFYFPEWAPRDVAESVLALTRWPFPPLTGFVECPVLRPDGSVLDQPGYDSRTALVYLPDARLEMPEVLAEPTREDALTALARVRQAYQDFPYKNGASWANALALLLTLVVRPAISGPVPLALIDGTKAGTGKGLLIETGSLIATGRLPAMLPVPANDNEELRKKLTSLLIDAPPLVVMDNIEAPLSSPELAAMLTSHTFGDRKLGTMENLKLPQRAVWVATGNNIKLRGDIPRRSYWIRLDAGVARPWEREGFAIPNLREWVVEHRGEMLAALLTIARAWWAAGKPKPPGKLPLLGSFEEWCRTLAGILAYVGIEGFLGNQDELYDQVDEENPEWDVFFTTWYEVLGARAVTTSEVLAALEASDEFKKAIPTPLAHSYGKEGESFDRRLGRALGKQADTVWPSGLRLTKAGLEPKKQRQLWRVATSAESPPVSLFSRFEEPLPPCDAPTHPEGVESSESVLLGGWVSPMGDWAVETGETGKPGIEEDDFTRPCPVCDEALDEGEELHPWCVGADVGDEEMLL
jgi:type II secretory pathway component PulM